MNYIFWSLDIGETRSTLKSELALNLINCRLSIVFSIAAFIVFSSSLSFRAPSLVSSPSHSEKRSTNWFSDFSFFNYQFINTPGIQMAELKLMQSIRWSARCSGILLAFNPLRIFILWTSNFEVNRLLQTAFGRSTSAFELHGVSNSISITALQGSDSLVELSVPQSLIRLRWSESLHSLEELSFLYQFTDRGSDRFIGFLFGYFGYFL